MVTNRSKIDTHLQLLAYGSPDMSGNELTGSHPENEMLLEDHRKSLSGYGLTGALAVVSGNSADETDLLIKFISGQSFIKGLVGWTDLQADDLPEQLDRYREIVSLKGFTHFLDKRSGSELLDSARFIRGVKVLKVYNYPFDLMVSSENINKVTGFAESLPGVKIALTQTGLDLSDSPAVLREREAILSELSFSPDIYFKIAPLYLSDEDGVSSKNLEKYLAKLLSIIGPDRIMYGSNRTISGVNSNISEISTAFSVLIEDFGSDVADKIFYKNAIEFYKLQV